MNLKQTPDQLLTREEVKKQFVDRGETYTEWAARNGFKREDVYALLNGRTAGRRGNAHRLAVRLGLKSLPPLDE